MFVFLNNKYKHITNDLKTKFALLDPNNLFHCWILSSMDPPPLHIPPSHPNSHNPSSQTRPFYLKKLILQVKCNVTSK